MSRFRATGKGFYNASPDAPATEADASAKLVDHKSGAVLYLYAVSVSTSWTLQGNASQTQARRTFYPQHLVQGDVIIKGRVANQYEYDRIVEFVEAHQHNMLGLNSSSSSIFGNGTTSGVFNASGGANQNQGDIGVEFMLLPATIADRWQDPPKGMNQFTDHTGSGGRDDSGMAKGPYHISSPMHVSGIITEVRAGAQRFVNAPEFEIGLKVTRDHREQPYKDLRDVHEAMGRYVLGLGTKYKPETVTGADVDTDPLDAIDDLIDTGQAIIDGLSTIWDNIT